MKNRKQEIFLINLKLFEGKENMSKIIITIFICSTCGISISSWVAFHTKNNTLSDWRLGVTFNSGEDYQLQTRSALNTACIKMKDYAKLNVKMATVNVF